MIYKGRPLSKHPEGYIDKALFTDLEEKEQAAVLGWIHDNITPASRTCKDGTSYGIKHLVQYELGIYMTNNQFKDAMLYAGYIPVNQFDLNWEYKIKVKGRNRYIAKMY